MLHAKIHNQCQCCKYVHELRRNLTSQLCAVVLSFHLLCPDLFDLSSLTERASAGQLSDLLMIQLLLQSCSYRKDNRIEVQTIRWPVFRFDKLPYVRVKLCDMNAGLISLTGLGYLTSLRLQRIFKYNDIQYTNLTPNILTNSLIYRTLFYVNIYGSYKLSKNSPVFWPTCTGWAKNRTVFRSL